MSGVGATDKSNPTRTCLPCANALIHSGKPNAVTPTNVMNSRRLISPPKLQERTSYRATSASAYKLPLSARCPLWAKSGHPAALFDHLVGTSKDRLRNCEAYCLSSLEIDHRLVLGSRLHRKLT